MNKARYRYFGLLLVFALLGFAVLSPARAAAPSWIGDGKFAYYYGGFKIELGTEGQPGYTKFQFAVNSNWTLSNTLLTQTTVSGGWNISIQVFFNGSTLFGGGFGTKGTEIVNIPTSGITTGGGFDFFGMEQTGHHTVLWVDDTTSLTASNITIGGRHSVTITSPMVLPFINASIPITRYYDTQVGMLLGFDLALNATSLGPLSGLGSLGNIVIPVIISSTNVVPYAWNPGGDLTLWLLAAGVIVGLSALFGVLIYSKKKR